jgi:phosphate transport system permease protein
MTQLERNEKLIQIALAIIAFSAISFLAVITFFIFFEGTPIIIKYGIKNFLFGLDWYPSEKSFGILPMIVGSIEVTAGALIIGIPLGLACAVSLTEFSSKRIRQILKPVIELLAGIPSVVYGFIGVVILVPFIRDNLGGPGLSVLAASIDSLLAVPRTYREGSIALGATQWQTTIMVMFPAARSGIVTSIILGMGRAIGETMAVIMIAGNAINIPHSILDPVRTLTSNIALEIGYSTGEHRQALFATGVVLFIIIMILNTAANIMSRKMKGQN